MDDERRLESYLMEAKAEEDEEDEDDEDEDFEGIELNLTLDILPRHAITDAGAATASVPVLSPAEEARIRETVALEKAELDQLCKRLDKTPYREDLNSLAARVGAETVLRVICCLEKPQDPFSSDMYRVMSKNLEHFKRALKSGSSFSGDAGEGGGGADDDDEDLPTNFMDPISLRLLNDPVIAADGHTYESECLSMIYTASRPLLAVWILFSCSPPQGRALPHGCRCIPRPR